jgi:hypothetical protein
MAYSSIAESETRNEVFSSYEHVGSILSIRSKLSNSLYLCVVTPSGADSAIRNTHLPGLVEVVNVGDHTDFIIESSPEDIGEIARRLHEQTGLPVGVVKYQDSYTPGLMQSNAVLAARRAAKNRDGFYVFDEHKDAVQYRLSHLIN